MAEMKSGRIVEWRRLSHTLSLFRVVARDGARFPSYEAGQYIATIERRQGLKIACPEEIAYRLGYIDAARLELLGNAMAKNAYGRYLLGLLREPLVR